MWSSTYVHSGHTEVGILIHHTWSVFLKRSHWLVVPPTGQVTMLVKQATCEKIPHVRKVYVIERFSFECRKVISFAPTTLHDWLKKLAPIFQPIRSKAKTNRDSFAHVFPRSASVTCNYFEFWLVHWIVCVLCDCLGFGFTTLNWKPLYNWLSN